MGLSEMGLVWARTNAGKSTLMLNMVKATPDVPTLIVNMEMHPAQQADWLTAMSFDVPVHARDFETVIRAGNDHPQYKELCEVKEMFGEAYPHLYFANPTTPSIREIGFILEDVSNHDGVKPQRVFIDHVGLLGGCEDYQGYGRVLGALHAWTMEQEVSTVAVQQTGRGGGDGVRNDGHVPVSISSGVFTGEQHADWILGMYRPERHPKFHKSQWDYKKEEDYWDDQATLETLRGLTFLQVLKNRPFSSLHEDGIQLMYQDHNRRLVEL